MSNISSTILAIAPGTREFGFAIINNAELLFYGVKTVQSRKDPLTILESINNQIHQLIEKYRPDYLAVEYSIRRQKSSALLAVVVEQIKKSAKQKNFPICEYMATSVRKHLCQTKRATKHRTAAVLASRFAELERYQLRTTKWERDYYGNLFNAIAVGVVCEEDFVISTKAAIQENISKQN